MKRLLVPLAVLALALPAQAGAKGFVSLSVCGTNGCHTTRNAHELDEAMQSIPQADPGRTGAFFKLRAGIGEPGSKRAFDRIESSWMPSVGVIRGDDGPLAGFTLPTPDTKAVLERLSKGLHPFPASKLPDPPGQPENAQVSEIVLPPASDDGQSGGGSDVGWLWSLLAIPAAGLGFWLHRRRRGGPELA